MDNSTTIPAKRCSVCREVFDLTTEYFHRDKGSSTGFASQCKACAKKYRDSKDKAAKSAQRKQYYQEHREHERATNRAYMQSRKEEIAERTARYRQTDNFKASKRKSRAKSESQQKTREYQARWNRENKDRNKVYRLKRKTLLRQLPNDFTHDDAQLALDYFHGCCAICGRQLNTFVSGRTFAFDHWIPLSSSECPGTIAENMLPVCHGIGGCNNSKKDREPTQWLTNKYGKQKARKIIERVYEYFQWTRLQKCS